MIPNDIRTAVSLLWNNAAAPSFETLEGYFATKFAGSSPPLPQLVRGGQSNPDRPLCGTLAREGKKTSRRRSAPHVPDYCRKSARLSARGLAF
jgi:hypothetical protein